MLPCVFMRVQRNAAPTFAAATSIVVCLAACNVAKAPASPGGVPLDAGMEPGSCPSAMVVASSDYVSTNVSVLATSGAPLSDSIISSASAPPGLTTALSGDVVVPLVPTVGEIVLV